jgi:hypothetical protein
MSVAYGIIPLNQSKGITNELQSLLHIWQLL